MGCSIPKGKQQKGAEMEGFSSGQTGAKDTENVYFAPVVSSSKFTRPS